MQLQGNEISKEVSESLYKGETELLEFIAISGGFQVVFYGVR